MSNKVKMIWVFTYSAGVLLLITAAAKGISASGHARILQNPESLSGLPFRTVFWFVGGLEAVVALVCFCARGLFVPNVLVAWLASTFVIYRIGLAWIGDHKPCPCLGNLTDSIHMSPQTANFVMMVILGYLLVGSYGSLLWVWAQRRRGLPTPGLQKPIAAVS